MVGAKYLLRNSASLGLTNMRMANILCGIAILIWFGLLLTGRGLVESVATQNVRGYPNVGQIETYVLLPALITIALLLIAWLCNGLHRWAWVLILAACLSLAILFPFLLSYSGGI